MRTTRMVPLGLCGLAAFPFLQLSHLWKRSLDFTARLSRLVFSRTRTVDLSTLIVSIARSKLSHCSMARKFSQVLDPLELVMPRFLVLRQPVPLVRMAFSL